MVRNNLDSLLKVDSKKALLNCHSCDALVYYSLRVPSTEKGVCLYPFFFLLPAALQMRPPILFNGKSSLPN